MKKILLLFFVVYSYNVIFAQLRYPIVGTYDKKSAQGMAIWGDKAYLFNAGGCCRVLNLSTGNVEQTFMVGSAAKGNHINNACFGKIRDEKEGKPLLYLSECNNSGKCFVEKLRGDSSVTVQTIKATKNGKDWRMTNWVIDNENSFLYGLTRDRKKLIDSIGNVVCDIVKYRIPSLDEGTNVLFSEKDVIDRYELIFPNILQGSKIRNNKLYMVTGLQQSIISNESQRAILVVDLKKKKLVKRIDLTYVTTNEPEDMDFYGRRALLYCGQEGGIYEIKLK